MTVSKDFEQLRKFHVLTIEYLESAKFILEQCGPQTFELVRLKIAPFLQVLRACAEQTSMFCSANEPKKEIKDEIIPDNVVKLKKKRPLEIDDFLEMD